MSKEEMFWFLIWSLVLTFVLALMLCVTFTLAGKREALRDMVSKGADPVRASCALSMHDDKTICVIDLVKGEMK